jgi:hypothetical protein
MDRRKRNRIKRSGWELGSVKEFLKLSTAEAARVELRLRVARPVLTRARAQKAFFKLAARLARSSKVADQKPLKRELARLTYGE